MPINVTTAAGQVWLQTCLIEAEGPSTAGISNSVTSGAPVVETTGTRPDGGIYYDVTFGIAVSANYRPLQMDEMFSSVPKLTTTELFGNYLDLATALEELKEYSFDDGEEIDEPVYTLACEVAGYLVSEGIPAPRVFSHGPKSVVFNWSDMAKSLYLTMSSNRISALISTPEKIKARINFTPEKFLAAPDPMLELNAMYRDRPLRITSDTMLNRPDAIE